MTTRQPNTLNTYASEVKIGSSHFKDQIEQRIISKISDALKLAYQEIEELKSQVNKQSLTKAD